MVYYDVELFICFIVFHVDVFLVFVCYVFFYVVLLCLFYLFVLV